MRGREDFLDNGYAIYLWIARTLIDGHGLCVAPGYGCAIRAPLYSLVLAPFAAMDVLYPGLVIVQSAVGGALVYVVWRMARDLFGPNVAVMAAWATAVNPYAVIHDTALQETAVFNLLIALSVYWLLRLRNSWSATPAWFAGCFVALATLTTTRVVVFVPGVLVWLVVAAPGSWRHRLRTTVLVLLPIVLLVGGWTMRNWYVVGAPVLSTDGGNNLWRAQNPWTFSHFPAGSIDASAREAYAHLTDRQLDALAAVEGRELARHRLLTRWGLDYALDDPLRTIGTSASKVWVVVSGQLSPARSPLVAWAYALVFLPVHVLALAGMWRSRVAWREHVPIYVLFAAFALTTAVFWAHTSHKSHLDAFLFIYAAAGAERWWRRLGPAVRADLRG